MTDEVDYTGHVDPTSTDALADLSRLGGQLVVAQNAVKDAEDKLAAAKKVVVDLAQVTIPELMDSVGLSRFTTREGVPFKIKESVHTHISKANHYAAMKWLDEHGHSQIVKRKVIVEFGLEQEDGATELAADLSNTYGEGGVDQTKAVHSSTLRAWAKEQLESGADVPLDLFGIHTRRVAQIG